MEKIGTRSAFRHRSKKNLRGVKSDQCNTCYFNAGLLLYESRIRYIHSLQTEIPQHPAHETRSWGDRDKQGPAPEALLRTGMHVPHWTAWDVVLSPSVSVEVTYLERRVCRRPWLPVSDRLSQWDDCSAGVWWPQEAVALLSQVTLSLSLSTPAVNVSVLLSSLTQPKPKEAWVWRPALYPEISRKDSPKRWLCVAQGVKYFCAF